MHYTFSSSYCSWRLLYQGHSVLWAPWSQKDHFRSWKFLESTHMKAHFGADEYLIIFGRTFYRIFLVSYHLKSDWFWGLCLTKRWFELMSKILWRIRGRGKAKCQHLSIAHPFDFKPELSQTKLVDTFLNLYIERKSKTQTYTWYFPSGVYGYFMMFLVMDMGVILKKNISIL